MRYAKSCGHDTVSHIEPAIAFSEVSAMKFKLLLVVAMSAGLVGLCGALIFEVANHEAREPDLIIKAVAHQWWWEFDYPTLGVRTSDVLYLPSTKSVRLELSSADVIHSFWIVGMKNPTEIVPGKARSVDLLLKSSGELYGNCNSGCGCATLCMRFRVLAEPPAQFQQWALAERLKPTAFKPRQQLAAPACATDPSRDNRRPHYSSNTPLQRLLDGGKT
jgi:cytochrome c oxidase subunit II